MRQLASFARSMFWTFGVMQALAGVYLMVAPFFRTVKATKHPTSPFLWIWIGLLFALPGFLSCFAAYRWRHNLRFARPLVGVASFCNLLLFPFGTVAGAVGLYWCFSKKMRDAEPVADQFEHKSQPGDGTHKWVQKIAPVAGVAIWLVSLGLVGWWGSQHHLPRRAPVDGLILIFACEWITTLFHELGHAVAGWIGDMRLAIFSVGPFVAQKRAGKWTFKLSLAGIIGAAGGGVVSTPLHLNNLRKRMAVEIAGGPIASVLTALAAFVILTFAPGSTWQIWWRVPALVCAMSASAAVFNSIPFGFAAGFSDGAAFLQILRGSAFADLRATMKMISSISVTEMRPRDLDAQTLTDGMRAGMGTPHEGVLQLIQVVCAVDRGDLIAAREHLENGLLRIPVPEKAPTPACAAEMALYMAYLDGDAHRAGAWLEGAEVFAAKRKAVTAKDYDFCSATLAIRMAQGRDAEASAAHAKCSEILAKRPQVGLYEFERDLVHTIASGVWLRPQAELEGLRQSLHSETGDATENTENVWA